MNGIVDIPEWVEQAQNDGVLTINIDDVLIVLNDRNAHGYLENRFSMALSGSEARLTIGGWVSHGTTLPNSWVKQ